MSENFHKRGWRWRWIAAGTLLILLSISVSSFLLIRYTNRSTPDKTLDAFCNALLQGNYQSAYNQFSKKLQQNISEEAFAAPLTQDTITTCTHGRVGDYGNQVTNELELVHASRGKNHDRITLVKDGNDDWKIGDISRLSAAIVSGLF